MVFVPPDRTMRNERMSRVGAAAAMIVAALAAVCIVAFGGDGGITRIAVVHRAAAVTSAPAPRPSTPVHLPPPRSWRTFAAQFPLPRQAIRVSAAHHASWRSAQSLASTKAFYVARVLALGLRWHPLPLREGKRIVGWAGTVDTPLADVVAHLSTRAGADGTTITVHR